MHVIQVWVDTLAPMHRVVLCMKSDLIIFLMRHLRNTMEISSFFRGMVRPVCTRVLILRAAYQMNRHSISVKNARVKAYPLILILG